jgi:glucokinase-like ROK family protein
MLIESSPKADEKMSIDTQKTSFPQTNRQQLPVQSGIDIPLSLLAVTPLEKGIIDLFLKNGEVTKADLISSLPYSRSKINNGISALIKKKYIKSSGAGEYTGGRRSIRFSMNGEFGMVAGVDIGATSIDIMLADLSGKRLARVSEPCNVRLGPVVILERVCRLLAILLDENNLPSERLISIGIGVPGPVDYENGMVVSPPIMPGWDGFHIVQYVQNDFPGSHVVVDNDVNVMALGEKFGGAARDHQNLIFVKIGTGIGSGIICNGEIYRGNNGCAGDIGHITVRKDGKMCHCGNTGCLEAMASGPAIAELGEKAAFEGRSPVLLKYFQSNGDKLRAEDVGLAASEGDQVAIEIIRSCGQMIGEVLAGLVSFFNPGMIVIGGGVSNIGNLLLSSIRQVVLRRSLPLATRDLRIVFSSKGLDAGVTGAMALAIKHIFCVEIPVED